MARRAVAASFVLGSLALVAGQSLLTEGCTQDFGTFDSSGGGTPSGSTSTTPASSGAGTPTSSSSSSKSSSSAGPGGGEGGGDGGGPTSTSTGNTGGQGGTGGGGCDGGTDCDDDNPCTTDTCDEGVCDNLPVVDGPIGGTDDPEDCRNHECVGGEEIDEADNTEDPADAAPPCELTICAGGQPTPDFADEGTTCGPDPQVCDGLGACLGCDPDGADSQCGAPTVCSSPTCEDPGACDNGFFDEGTPVTDPTDGDCQMSQCSGDSVIPESVDDPTDVPADRPCGDASCDGGTPDFDIVDEGDPCLVGTGVCDGAGDLVANCKTCRDTVAGAGTDPGCTAGAPICDETGGGGLGVCHACRDTVAGGGTDSGCVGATPICVESDAGGVGACHVCLDDVAGAGTDAGCPSNQVCDPAGLGDCVGCYTDGGNVAVNCNVGEVCDADDETCGDCADTALGSADAGCTDPLFPACEEGGSDGCEECQDPEDCATHPEGHLCNQGGDNDECGCTGNNVADAASCTGSSRGSKCLNNTACGCQGGVGSGDCNDAGSAGPNCNGSGVCVP